jgi:hypothetical protein
MSIGLNSMPYLFFKTQAMQDISMAITDLLAITAINGEVSPFHSAHLHYRQT